MRVAALYDVHGNVHALDAVLAEVECAGVDVILFGGDLAWGPFPRETLELARSVPNAHFVRGNADELSEIPEEDERLPWVLAELGDDREWLEQLPFSWSVDDTLYVHANPRDTEEPYFAWTNEVKLAAVLESVAESRVVSGHVHMQSNTVVGDKEWTCAGSVGFPYAEERGAYWTLLANGAPEFRRTEYDYEAVATQMRMSGHPWADRYAEMILRPMTPDEVRETWAREYA